MFVMIWDKQVQIMYNFFYKFYNKKIGDGLYFEDQDNYSPAPPPPPNNNFRITDSDDFRVTDSGDFRVIDLV